MNLVMVSNAIFVRAQTQLDYSTVDERHYGGLIDYNNNSITC